ncbi:MAG: hypothetical protein FWB76_07250 [Oscillospiraceae bacterium]|nr:hypothetical protein [Oscillospiraceae bacterium]
MMKFTRKQWVLAGLVGLLIARSLVGLGFTLFDGGFTGWTLWSVFSTLLMLAFYLKLVLPWPKLSHRKWLGWILGIMFVNNLAEWAYRQIFAHRYFASEAPLTQADYFVSITVASSMLVTLTVLSPYFWLLINTMRGKTTHKVATIVTFVALGLFTLTILGNFFMSRLESEFFLPPNVWDFIAIAEVTLFAIVLLKHPVLARPILAPEAEPTPEEVPA